MKKNNKIERLKELLFFNSKHSQYQKLPSCLDDIINIDKLTGKYENERMDYVLSKIQLGNKVLDIGGNAGFFTFESITRGGAKEVECYEGNKELSECVEIISQLCGLENMVTVHNEYYISSDEEDIFDTIFFMNVLHHLGKDYEDGIEKTKARHEMVNELNKLAKVGSWCVFQMGYNWGGDKDECLFENGTKDEMIDFIKSNTSQSWEVINIGIPIKKGGQIIYEDLTDDNIQRYDELGEFLNRPLFILKSCLNK